MTKNIEHELRYDGATAAQVFEMLQDPSFREAVCDYQQVLRKTVTITPKGEGPEAGMDVVIDQFQSAQGIPSFAKKIVGEEINIVQKEQWHSPTDGDIQVVIPGKPGEMKGTATITEDASGAVETVRLSVKVGIPLVGGKLEDLISGLLVRALKAENKVGRDRLKG